MSMNITMMNVAAVADTIMSMIMMNTIIITSFLNLL